MGIYRERKRAILKSLIRQYGKLEAYDMYGEFIGFSKHKCPICGGHISEYSEWHDTGYEIRECKYGCFKHETFGLTDVLETKGFYFKGKLTSEILDDFEKQIKENAERAKYISRSCWKKKKSQRKRA